MNGKENLDDTLISSHNELDMDNDGHDRDHDQMDSVMLMSSPVSPRVKNIKQDMEALLISRQDNPYISQKLELLSNSADFQSLSNLNSSSLIQVSIEDSEQGLISMDYDVMDDELAFTSAILDEPGLNLHEHLIRSPPPQFPQKVSHFVFPDTIGSPLRGCMLGGKSSSMMSPMSCRGAGGGRANNGPELSLLSLSTPPPPPHVTPTSFMITYTESRRCSHPMMTMSEGPMDDDTPSLSNLTPLLPAQRAVSGPLPALSPLPTLARGGAASSTLIANVSG